MHWNFCAFSIHFKDYKILSVAKPLYCFRQTSVLKTRMTTFIKTKFKKSDDQTNIDKYRVEYYRISYYIKINLPENHYSKIYKDKAIIALRNVCKNVKNQNV